MFALQVLVNMGVVLGLLPTKGLVLPFLSYGGSAMLISLAAIGILMSLSRELRER
jgi:cell division protein FtsW